MQLYTKYWQAINILYQQLGDIERETNEVIYTMCREIMMDKYCIVVLV